MDSENKHYEFTLDVAVSSMCSIVALWGTGCNYGTNSSTGI